MKRNPAHGGRLFTKPSFLPVRFFNGVLNRIHDDAAAVGGATDCIDGSGLGCDDSLNNGFFSFSAPPGLVFDDNNPADFMIRYGYVHGRFIGPAPEAAFVDSVFEPDRINETFRGRGHGATKKKHAA